MRAQSPTPSAGPSAQPSAQSAPTAHPSPKWESSVAAFEKADVERPPEKGGILFIGSSSIRLWSTLASDFPGKPVLNRGFGGSQIADSVYYHERLVLAYAPRQIVFYAGGNDINAKKAPQQVAADFRAFVEKVRAKLPEVHVAYISIAPNPARWAQVEQVKEANSLIRSYCASQSGMDFIDVFPHMLGTDGQPLPHIYREDRLHMNPEGYKIWTRIVAPHLL